MKKTVLITGASSGIGKEVAKLFAANGYNTYASARNTERMADLQKIGCHVIAIDVTDETSMKSAMYTIGRESGGVDILINNAGYGQNGVIEELSLDEIKRQFDVNVFGVLRMTQLVVPFMRDKGKGRIVITGSVGGEFTTPGAGAYHASKYAIESFADALRQELRQFGIFVSLVKPGGVRTNFINEAGASYPAEMPGSPYKKFRESFLKTTNDMFSEKSSYGILTAEEVSKVIFKAATMDSPKSRYRIGILAKMTPIMRRTLGDNLFDKMIAAQFSAK